SKRSEKRAVITRVPSPAPVPAALAPWQKPEGLSRRGWVLLAALVLLVNFPVIHRFLRGPLEATVSIPYADDFGDGVPLTQRYFSTGGDWRVRDGILISPGVHNNALWLKAKLPDNVRISFEARAIAPEADVRFEVFGNGEDTLSGYRLVLTPSGGGVRPVLY